MPASALGFYQPYYDVMPDGKAMILDEGADIQEKSLAFCGLTAN